MNKSYPPSKKQVKIPAFPAKPNLGARAKRKISACKSIFSEEGIKLANQDEYSVS